MKPITRIAISSLLLNLCATAALAQQDPLGADERGEAMAAIGKALDESYVFPELGVACRKFLDEAAASGAFDDCDDPVSFARRLTDELQRITKDKHLRVRHREPKLVEQERGDPIATHARMVQFYRERNYGFRKVERLEGNIGYLDMSAFVGIGEGRPAAAAAMQMLQGADAVIVDMRNNGGGDPGMVQFVCSYFFGEKTHLNSLYFREGDRTTEFWTLDELPGARMPDVPLYVLTSSRTFSAAEEFTYNLKTRERATIIGEVTGGGANPGGTVPIGRRFRVFVPRGRAINPVTKTNWEGVGVQPDVACAAADAFDKALALAGPAAKAFHECTASERDERVAKIRDAVTAADQLAGKQRWRDASASMTEALQLATAGELWNEPAINELGYRYLRRQLPELAITIFGFNVEQHPKSANCYDSLGEACLAAGKRAEAIANYERSLQLDPGNDNGRRMLEKIRTEQAGGSDGR